jgi:hypothetical protein
VQIPDAVRGYLIHFYHAYLENNVHEMQGCYENQLIALRLMRSANGQVQSTD